VGKDEHRNAVLIRRLYDAYARRDRDTISSLIAEDCRWIIPGRGAQAGVYEGRVAILELFRGMMRDSNGTARIELEAVVADDQYAVVLQRGSGTIRGKSAVLDECLVHRIEGGRVVEMKEYQFDLYTLDEWLNAPRERSV
jgi:hypothetical protein